MTHRINFELLKDAYAILGGIPEAAYNLDSFVTKSGESKSCGTVACGMGWLAMHPQFRALGLGLTELYSNERPALAMSMPTYKGRDVPYTKVAGRIFGVSEMEARGLFSGRTYTDRHHGDNKHRTDKQVLLNRIMRLLDKHDQVEKPIYL